jgi:hypothetical protein
MRRKRADQRKERYDNETTKDDIGNRGVLHVLRVVVVMVLRLPRASFHDGCIGGYAALFRATIHGG